MKGSGKSNLWRGALKMQEWKKAGVENAGADSRGGKCRSGKCRSDIGWKAVRKEKYKIPTT